jgi:hypothetical protein
MGTNINCINPFGWANKGEKELLCPFLLSVGVTPRSLDYDEAIAGAVDVKAILAKVWPSRGRSCLCRDGRQAFGPFGRRTQAPPVGPHRRQRARVPKHFSSALGLPIAPLGTPYYEGTGAHYFHLGSDTKDIALLTCAHVVRPAPAFPDNKGMQRTSSSQPKEC